MKPLQPFKLTDGTRSLVLRHGEATLVSIAVMFTGNLLGETHLGVGALGCALGLWIGPMLVKDESSNRKLEEEEQ